MDNLTAKVFDIASKKQATQTELCAETDIKEAQCEHIIRQKVEHGVAWNCPHCAQKSGSWDPQLFEAINHGQQARAVCHGCQKEIALKAKPDSRIITPSQANRIAIPTMQIQGKAPRGR